MVLYCLDIVDGVGLATETSGYPFLDLVLTDMAGGLVTQSGVPFVRDDNGEEKGVVPSRK